MEIRYFGWSGVTIRHADTSVGFDLFGDEVTWDAVGDAATTILCLTHGHPEHCGSLRRLLSASDAHLHLARTHLVSSPAVVEYITHGGSFAQVNRHSLRNAEGVSIASTQVTTFTWKHMPLLPPGVRPKIEYITHLLSRPIGFVRISTSSIGLPIRAPTLGFHITFADGRTILNYAEGLHRLTDPREVESVARTLPVEVLLFAVEPEDVDVVPRWLKILRPATIFLYEAHRPWRELFRLPYIDLRAYATELSSRYQETRFNVLIYPGQSVTI